MTVDAAYIIRRLRATWPVLIFTTLFMWLDWITHRDAAFIVIIGLLVAAVVVFGPAIIAWLNLTATVAMIPWWIKPFLFAAPAYIYLLSRGQGTTDAGTPIVITGLILLAALLAVGPSLDARLAGFYQARNRLVPRPLRIVLSPLIAIVLSFLIVHGDLSSLPAFWGGSTQTRKRAAETDTSLFVIAALLSTIVTLLLLREVETRRLHLATARRQPGSQPGLTRAAAAEQRCVVPDGGTRAWNAPDAIAAPVTMLAARTELAVVERTGVWARVRASNGWIGWVDGRALITAARPSPVAVPSQLPAPVMQSPAPAPAPESATAAAPASTPASAPAPAAPVHAPAAERARVPAGGMLAWAAPDTGSAAVSLAPGLDLEVVHRHGAWAQILASNGWTGWVDGRALIVAPPAVPVATSPVPAASMMQPPVPAPVAPVATQPAPPPVTISGPAAYAAPPRARVPAGGTLAWPAPDPAAPAIRLAPGLELEVVHQQGAWTHVRASNGWMGWVDGRILEGGGTAGGW